MLNQATLAFIHSPESSPNEVHVLKLGSIVPTFHCASNSVILALAAYLTWRFPSLHHQHYRNYSLEDVKGGGPFPIPELSLHPMFEPWCDTLCEQVVSGHAIRSGNTLYILVNVEEWQVEEMLHLGLTKETYKSSTPIHKIFDVKQVQYQSKKIMLMNFATSQLRKNQLLPKIHLPALLIGSLFNNENWSYYCILKGEIPTAEQLSQADTLIFPGSSNSVLDAIEPVDKFLVELEKANELNPSLKILSICYGHQLVSRIHGGRIVRKNRFEGHELVQFDRTLTKKYKFLDKITNNMDRQFLMPEHHEDYVENVPEEFDLIATSQSCFVQAMVRKDGRMLSLQFHPEYLSEYTIAFTKRAQIAKQHYHISFALEIEQQKLQIHHQSCIYVRECIKAFIESQPDSTQLSQLS